MRIKDPFHEAEEPYNLIPLTDMVFNLLIFFMCATTFVQVEKEMSLELPKTGSAKGMANPASAEQLIINIDRDGKIIISGKAYDKDTLARRVADADSREQRHRSVRVPDPKLSRCGASGADLAVRPWPARQ